jgi:hypothetical protein
MFTGGGVDTLPKERLIASPSTNDDDSVVRVLGGLDGFGEPALVVGPELATLGIVDFDVGSTKMFLESVEWGESVESSVVEDVVTKL